MKKSKEINFLRILFIFGIGSVIKFITKPPMKNWVVVFLFKSYIASILDNIIVKKGYIKYPVKLFRIFDISVIFSYLIFPITCVYFNQVTKNSKIKSILFICLLFTAPSTWVEYWLEKNTSLVKYKKSWTWVHSFVSIACTFLFVRALMSVFKGNSGQPD